MSAAKDLTGQIFGRLLVSSRDVTPRQQKYKHVHWVCLCDCGNILTVRSSSLSNGHTKSCGCYQQDKVKETLTLHGLSRTRIHRIWRKMFDRCYNEACDAYEHYGGRGIVVCDEWKDFIKFYNDMVDGYSDNLSIDRINVNGNYCKANCKWSTQADQVYNQRKRKTNTSGRTGVYSVKNKWKASIGFDGGVIPIGYFDTFEEAVAAREAAELKFYGFNKE